MRSSNERRFNSENLISNTMTVARFKHHKPFSTHLLCCRRMFIASFAILIFLSILDGCVARRRDGSRFQVQPCSPNAHSCDENAVCIPTKRSHRCECRPGFLGDGWVCKDEDECAQDNGGCVQKCVNTPGHFNCSCFDGFTLAPDGRNCIDKNECLETRGGCSHQCINTLGSFECACSQGYSLDVSGTNCIYGEWCRKMYGCDHGCKNKKSSNTVRCYCRDGYYLQKDGRSCVRSCETGNGGCQHTCTATHGSGPMCACAPGYLLNADNRTCTASCTVNNGGCERRCVDSESGPVCSCPHGFRLHQDGVSCIDIDECMEKSDGCSHTCENTRGDFECICPSGYKVDRDHRTCVDIDECEMNSTCSHNCENKPGSFTCYCNEGYQLYGVTHCADINECLIRNGGCAHTCANMAGSYTCACAAGYKLHSNKHDCIDERQCTPLTQRPNSNLTCSHSGLYSQTCVMTCGAKGHLTLFPPTHSEAGRNGQAERVGIIQSKSPGAVSFECGPKTGYSWTGLDARGELPYCSELISAPSMSRRATFVVLRETCKHTISNVMDLKSNLTYMFNKEKKYRCDGQCNVRELDLICGSRRKKFRKLIRRKKRAIMTVEFEIQMNPRNINKKCGPICQSRRIDRRFNRTLKKIRRVVKRKKFRVAIGRKSYRTVKRSFKSYRPSDRSCPDGLQLINKTCIGCGHGYFFNRNQLRCTLCPRGTYQDEEGQLSCKPCSTSTPEVGVWGATSLYQCDTLCEPGSFSQSGHKPCQACSPGTFQPFYGRQACLQCGPGLFSDTSGSTQFKECRPKVTCPPGQFYNTSTHTCSFCQIGFFQPEKGQDLCLPCPVNTTTDFSGSIKPDSCKNRTCGQYWGDYWGMLESPNYPGDYPVDVTCVWKIRPERKRRILVIVPRIDLADEKTCGDVIVMRKSNSEYSESTFQTCASRDTPIAFTARSRRLWVQFKSNSNNTARGFSIPFVTYNEDYESLINDIVRDRRLYSSKQHQQIFQDWQLLSALLEVIATPYNYLKYANVQDTMFPPSFIRLLTPKVRRFFQT